MPDRRVVPIVLRQVEKLPVILVRRTFLRQRNHQMDGKTVAQRSVP